MDGYNNFDLLCKRKKKRLIERDDYESVCGKITVEDGCVLC